MEPTVSLGLFTFSRISNKEEQKYGSFLFWRNHFSAEPSQQRVPQRGKAPLVLPAIRQKYGFPAKGETRFYFAISQSGEAIVIQQDYAPPSNGRISDEISVYRLMRTRRADYDKRFFQELASDLLFKTHSAEFPANEAIAIQTWSLFTEAITKIQIGMPSSSLSLPNRAPTSTFVQQRSLKF